MSLPWKARSVTTAVDNHLNQEPDGESTALFEARLRNSLSLIELYDFTTRDRRAQEKFLLFRDSSGLIAWSGFCALVHIDRNRPKSNQGSGHRPIIPVWFFLPGRGLLCEIPAQRRPSRFPSLGAEVCPTIYVD
jgi:hypothetical protein